MSSLPRPILHSPTPSWAPFPRLASAGSGSGPTVEQDPARIYGPLFLDVQRRAIFADQKTFADCVPKEDPELIRRRYEDVRAECADPARLRQFVLDHFLVPEVVADAVTDPNATVEEHIHRLWKVLRRDPDSPVRGSSLLPLAHPYAIPGGRFREVYYWDSYFTMLGLHECGEVGLLLHMVENFADLIRRCGLIPNGNRTYYLTRSQPPALALMLELLASTEGDAVYPTYLPALQAELDGWNDQRIPSEHRVTLPSGHVLHRYWDAGDYPRSEALAHDEMVALQSNQPPAELFRHLRSAAESGWDFSSRWFVGGGSLAYIRTTEFLPVDLNCLLFQLERTLAHAYRLTGNNEECRRLEEAAERRREAIDRYCWSPSDGFYFDYHYPGARRSPHLTLAGVTPLFLGLASQAQADAVAETLRTKFLQPGGLVTTLVESGEQWDAPNGWAPMQWMAIAGLELYGHTQLAAEIAHRWITLNAGVHARCGRFLEKYNVMDLSLPAGGGEYPTQEGFGWTNGVLIKLLRMYPPPQPVEPERAI